MLKPPNWWKLCTHPPACIHDIIIWCLCWITERLVGGLSEYCGRAEIDKPVDSSSSICSTEATAAKVPNTRAFLNKEWVTIDKGQLGQHAITRNSKMRCIVQCIHRSAGIDQRPPKSRTRLEPFERLPFDTNKIVKMNCYAIGFNGFKIVFEYKTKSNLTPSIPIILSKCLDVMQIFFFYNLLNKLVLLILRMSFYKRSHEHMIRIECVACCPNRRWIDGLAVAFI